MLCVVRLLLWLLLPSVGAPPSDPNPRLDETLFRLRVLSTLVIDLDHKGEEVSGMCSLDQLLKRAADAGMISVGEYSQGVCHSDAWGHPFGYAAAKAGERLTIVTLRSRGRNGIDESGGGDDLYVEIMLERGKAPIILGNAVQLWQGQRKLNLFSDPGSPRPPPLWPATETPRGGPAT